MFKKVALAVAVAFAAQGASAAAIDFHGYVREGVGSTTKGGKLPCYGDPAATFKAPYQQSRGRLGSECDNYAELNFGAKVYKGNDGVQFNYVTTFASIHDNRRDAQAVSDTGDAPAGGGSDGFALLNRESYVSGTGLSIFGIKPAEVWVGKRFYQRHDIHVTDEFYVGNTGAGWGIAGIDLGFGKLSYAFFQTNDKGQGNNDSTSRHDLRLAGIPVAKDISLEVAFQTLKGNPAKDSAKDGTEELSTAFWGELTVSNFMGGFNKTYVGLYNKNAAWDGVDSYSSGYGSSDAKLFTVINHGKVNLSNDLELGHAVRLNKWTDAQNNTTALQVVVRPHLTLTENTALVFEGELDRVLASDGVGSHDSASAEHKGAQLVKLTGAYTLQAGKGWWARPQVRFYTSYYKWNDAATAWWNGAMLDSRFNADQKAMVYGVQVEAWW